MGWRYSLDGEPSPRGLTWIELLVILFVIGIVAALLLPAVNTSREAPGGRNAGTI